MKGQNLIIGIVLTALTACGGGGGGGGDNAREGGGGSVSGGTVWIAHADVAQNNCGERISAVNQVFTVGDGAVFTGIFSAPAVNNGGTIEFGYEEANGDCTRTYTGEITPSGSTADVALSAKANCAGVVCENRWAGIATKQ